MSSLLASDVLHILKDDDAARHDQLLTDLTMHPVEAALIYEELALHRDPIVRAWVPWAARRTNGKAAVPLIKRLTKDRDPDVRDVAVEELLETDIAASQSLAPALRRKLRSKELYEPVTAMWALATIRDRSSLNAIRDLGNRATNAVQRNTAAVVTLILEDRGSEIVDRIIAHDHERMAWLSKGARLLRTAAGLGALKFCAEEAPDDECRAFCRSELERK